MAEPRLIATGLSMIYAGQAAPALDDVSFSLDRGETLALVGPSGSGKSSLARALLRLLPLRTGEILFDGDDWLRLDGARLRRKRAGMQMVFQDALSAFNPRATVAEIITDPLRVQKRLSAGARQEQLDGWLERLGLSGRLASRRADEISGGQRQRVALARALILTPALVVLDEAFAALDATTRADMIALLQHYQAETGASLLFISHDLAVAAQLAQRVAVMDGGRIVECGLTGEVLTAPQAPVTKALIAAVPKLRW